MWKACRFCTCVRFRQNKYLEGTVPGQHGWASWRHYVYMMHPAPAQGKCEPALVHQGWGSQNFWRKTVPWLLLGKLCMDINNPTVTTQPTFITGSHRDDQQTGVWQLPYWKTVSTGDFLTVYHLHVHDLSLWSQFLQRLHECTELTGLILHEHV